MPQLPVVPARKWSSKLIVSVVVAIVGLLLLGGGSYWDYLQYQTKAEGEPAVVRITRKVPPPVLDVFSVGGDFGAVLYDGSQSHIFGTLVSDVPWATIKVSIALAALAQGAADPGLVAPAPVVNSAPSRHGFSVFGQMEWTLASQAELGCHPNAAIVTDKMGLVTPEQRYGLGRIPGMRFKGGWGPDPSGGYFARQFGFVETPAGRFGVAIAARPTDGSYTSAQMMLDEVTSQLQLRMVAGGALNCAELPH
ncbi:hypothetical protein HW450_09345 [Corynebacterium hindlerae]|uniref:Uncharacterized protein n=1 Tax=Corynebacterium hindlerae TaxID=699041 RepID=A0A7G5FD71_9CORY|nr:hypothetical protein [Corynebacterium hindlerae]QMV84562.1 hypothetical protein HW450_09345 [Corynebacterium hindlerae]